MKSDEDFLSIFVTQPPFALEKYGSKIKFLL